MALTAMLALVVGGSLAFAAASGAAKKHPKSSIEIPSAGTVVETGSTLLYPLFNLWSAGYSTKYPSVTVQTAGTGSGTGITNALTGLADIGASDAYLAPTQLATTPSALNIPLAISAQLVVYDLPGVTAHLTLSGMVLSQIYLGKITTWNDPAIAALNPSVPLPDIPIAPLHRAESSWDTFLFSTFLSDADPSGWGNTLMFNTTIAWPAGPGAVGEIGNSGMVSGCKATPGCIAYIGISYQTQALQAGLVYAALENAKGQSELPTPATVAAEAASAKKIPANGTQSLIYLKASRGYPIVNFEYAIVNSTQTSTAKAKDIRSVLEWAINPADGNDSSYLAQVNFQPLPATVEKQALKQIATIQ
jgi:phosphate transport system substrate-binding protein